MTGDGRHCAGPPGPTPKLNACASADGTAGTEDIAPGMEPGITLGGAFIGGTCPC